MNKMLYIHTYILYLFQKQTIYTDKTKKKSTSRKGSLEVSPMRKLPQIKEKQKISIHKSRSLESNIQIHFELRFKMLKAISFHYIAR